MTFLDFCCIEETCFTSENALKRLYCEIVFGNFAPTSRAKACYRCGGFASPPPNTTARLGQSCGKHCGSAAESNRTFAPLRFYRTV